MKLFGHPDSGHALKSGFFMDWLAMDYQYEYVDIFAPSATRSAEFLNASTFSEVPTLIDNGRCYIQSNAILLYLAEKAGVFRNAEERQKCLEWLVWEANKIGLCLPQIRADKKLSGQFSKFALSEGAREWLLARYDHDVHVLDKALADARPFIQGEYISPADFSLSAYLMYADEAEVQVPQNVQAWLGRLKMQKGWQSPYLMLKG